MEVLDEITAWLYGQCNAGFKHYTCQLAAFSYGTCYYEIPLEMGDATISDVVVAAFALVNLITSLVSLYKWTRRLDKDEQASLRQNYGSFGTSSFFAMMALASAVFLLCTFNIFGPSTAVGIGLRAAYVGLYSAAWATFGLDQFCATVSRRLSRTLAVLAALACLGIGPLVAVSLNLITPKFVPDREMQVFVLTIFLVAVPVAAMVFCLLGSLFTACRGSLIGSKPVFIVLSLIGLIMAAAGPAGHYYWWSSTCPAGVSAQVDISMIEQVATFLCIIIIGQAGACHANMLSKGTVEHTTMAAAFNDATYGDAPPAYEGRDYSAGFMEAGHIAVDPYDVGGSVPYGAYSAPPTQYHAMGYLSPPNSARSNAPLLGHLADDNSTHYSTVSTGTDATRIVVPPPSFAPAVEPYDPRLSPRYGQSPTHLYGPSSRSSTIMFGPPAGSRTASMYGPPISPRGTSSSMYGPPLSPRAQEPGSPAAEELWMPRGEEDLRHIAEIHASLQNLAGIRPLSISENDLRFVLGDHAPAPELAPYEAGAPHHPAP